MSKAPVIKATKIPGVPESKRRVTEAIQHAMVAPAINIETTVLQAAEKLGLDHEFVLKGLLDEAIASSNTGAERISALKTIGEWIGTAKEQPTVHNHLHAHLAQVPTDRLEDHIARIIQGIPS